MSNPVAESFAVDMGETPRARRSFNVGRWVPIASLQYSFGLFVADLRSALTVTFVLIPQAVAFAHLAKVSPIQALISGVFPLVVYAMLGSSRHLSVGRSMSDCRP
jgi:SulP family sulfate permease